MLKIYLKWVIGIICMINICKNKNIALSFIYFNNWFECSNNHTHKDKPEKLKIL